MKKVYTVYLTGLMIIVSYIFTFSIFEIYGLNNIGDTSLTDYQIKYDSGNDLLNLYNELIIHDAAFQVVKNPMSDNNITYHDIYHNKIESINKFVGVSDNTYRYFQMEQDDFVDSNGYFSTNMSYEKLLDISMRNGIEINIADKTKLSYFDILFSNFINFIILGITTLIIMYIYTIFRYKTNAVKKLTGFSPTKIVLTNIKETIVKLIVITTLLVTGYSIYFWINNKFSWFYSFSLLLFLLMISICITMLLLALQKSIKKIKIVDVLNNRFFSNRLYILVYTIKIILIVAITIATNLSIESYKSMDQIYKKMDEYRLLDHLYSSHGRNADQYDKLYFNPDLLSITADNVKALYKENSETAYVMSDTVRDNLYEHFLDEIELTREELMNSYERNYVILNKNYIEDYTDIEIKWDIDENVPTVLVPKKYQAYEQNIKTEYAQTYESLVNYNTRYGIKVDEVRVNDVQIVYIENGLSYKILSSIPYEDEVDIELVDSVIVLDNGHFGSAYYYDLLGSSELAFKLDDRDEFKNLLIQYELSDLYMVNTLLTPFESVISNYEFLLDQTMLFIFLFIVLLIFIIYISNRLDMVVNGKTYAARYILGYSTFKNLKLNIIIMSVLILNSIILYLLNINLVIYLLFLIYDLFTMLYLYRRLVINQLINLMDGGN